MGESPREKADREQRDKLNNMISQSQQQYSDLMKSDQFNPQLQFAQVNPFFQQASQQVQNYGGLANQYLSQGFNQQLAGLGANAGESILASGAARGQSQINPFISATAPAIAQREGAMSNLQQNIGAQLSNINQNQGNTLLNLLKSGNSNILSLLGLEQSGVQGMLGLQNQAIGGMKGSTALGDVLGTIQTIASIGLPILTGVSGMGASAGAGGSAASSAGGINPSLFGFGGGSFNPQDYSNFTRTLPLGFGE